MNEFRAWVLSSVGSPLELRKMDVPELRPTSVLVRMRSAMVLSYMGKVLDGAIPYALPALPFVPGTKLPRPWPAWETRIFSPHLAMQTI